jgi:hypothetical protein
MQFYYVSTIKLFYIFRFYLHKIYGRDVAQAVSPISASRIRAQIRSCWNCGGQSGTGVGFCGFLYQFSFHLLVHTHHLSSGADRIGQLMADVPSGLSLTPP